MKFTGRPFELPAENERKLIDKREAFREETGAKLPLKPVFVPANGTTGHHDGAIAEIIALDDFVLGYVKPLLTSSRTDE